MTRLTYLVSFLIVIAAVVSAKDLSTVIAPVARALHNKQFHSVIRTGVKYSKGLTVKGSVDGGYEGPVIKGGFSGDVDVSSNVKENEIDFKFSTSGKIKETDVYLLPFKSKLYGYLSIYGKRAELKAKYKWSFYDGTIAGKKVKGSGKGSVMLNIYGKDIEGKQEGKMMLYIAGKKLDAKYKIVIKTDAIGTYVVGKFDGEKFFLNYESSLNLASLGVHSDPTEISRVYGKITVTKNGKKFTEKFDVKDINSLAAKV